MDVACSAQCPLLVGQPLSGAYKRTYAPAPFLSVVVVVWGCCAVPAAGTPIHAVMADATRYAELLQFAAGKNINGYVCRGKTWLHIAVGMSMVELVDWLLGNGADMRKYETSLLSLLRYLRYHEGGKKKEKILTLLTLLRYL